jgi:ABC-type dipeptide/oligopeptide/nickel transport system ATPase component
MESLLEVENLVIEFDTAKGRRRVVDEVSLELAPGEVLGILGESGSGKTVTTLAVLGLVNGQPGVAGGSIRLQDGDQTHELLDGLDDFMYERRGQRYKHVKRWGRAVGRRMQPIWGRCVTAIFQNPRHSIDPLMTIGAQVEESVRLAHPDDGAEAVNTRAIGWLTRVQLNDPPRVHRSYAHELSGGMCQRAMIAVALAREPQILIADEPTTGLDTTVRAEIVELFRQLLEERERSMLYISHDIREVLYLADRVIIMRHGKVVEAETADNLRNGVGTRAAYTKMLLGAADIDPGGAS